MSKLDATWQCTGLISSSRTSAGVSRTVNLLKACTRALLVVIQLVAAVQLEAVSDSKNYFDRVLGVGNIMSPSGKNLNIRRHHISQSNICKGEWQVGQMT